MIKYKTSTHRSQVKLDFNLVTQSTTSTEKVPVELLNSIVAPFGGDGVVSGNPPPHLPNREEYRLAHMSMSEVEFDKVWGIIEENRKKAEKCGK